MDFKGTSLLQADLYIESEPNIFHCLMFNCLVYSFAMASQEKIWSADMSLRNKLSRINISAFPRFIWTSYLLTQLNPILLKLQDYNKFDLPFPNEVNPIDIGIDITDVLRINDKVCMDTTIQVLFRVWLLQEVKYVCTLLVSSHVFLLTA